MKLVDKYRPQSLGAVVGQPRAVKVIHSLAARGELAGRAYWVAGGSGQGKSTLAYLVAREVADPFNIEEIDATGLSAAAIQEIERSSACRGLGEKNGRAFIVNEAHGLNKAAIRQLLTTLERIPRHCVWIFTTTNQGQAALFDGIDADPLLSRCTKLPMAQTFAVCQAFAARAQEIARAELLDGRAIEDYVKLVKEMKGNFRAVLQEIEAGRMLADDMPLSQEANAAAKHLLGR